ncbi:MAG: M20/M25/M40 family metallo-hydrolase [Elusimicrobiota bacterium]
MTNQQTAPVFLDSNTLTLIKTAAKDCLIPYLLLPSWAAHDALIMSNICLTGMIFVRSHKGLSHCPQEFSSPEDIAFGAELLYSVLSKTANDY